MSFDEKKRVDYNIMALKRSLNICKEKNNKLKKHMNELKEEVKLKDLHLKKLFDKATHLFCVRNKSPLGPAAETELKNHVRTTQKKIDKARRQKEELTNNVKDSIIEDTQEELKNSLEECRRLRAMIEMARTEHTINTKVNFNQLLLENKRLLSIVEKQNYELDRLNGVQKKKERIGLRSCLTEVRRSVKPLITNPIKNNTRKSLFNENESKKESISIC